MVDALLRAWSMPAGRRSGTTARSWPPPPMASSSERSPSLTDAIGTAEATAVVVWRGESIPYRGLRNRISEISGRAERNGLYASYLEAEEALNPMRRGALRPDRRAGSRARLRRLRRADQDDPWLRPRRARSELRDFLAESETPYFAALRRYLARIEIEQGDASLADLWYLMRGSGWDNWFDGRRIMAVARLDPPRPGDRACATSPARRWTWMRAPTSRRARSWRS